MYRDDPPGEPGLAEVLQDLRPDPATTRGSKKPFIDSAAAAWERAAAFSWKTEVGSRSTDTW